MDDFLKTINDLPISNTIRQHYRKCFEQGGLCRRGVEFAIKIASLKPRKK